MTIEVSTERPPRIAGAEQVTANDHLQAGGDQEGFANTRGVRTTFGRHEKGVLTNISSAGPPLLQWSRSGVLGGGSSPLDCTTELG